MPGQNLHNISGKAKEDNINVFVLPANDDVIDDNQVVRVVNIEKSPCK